MKRLAREAAWAPVAVLALAWCVGRTRFAHDLWWSLHVLGGAALAFFFLRAAGQARLRYAAAFALACSGALGWELAEYAIDQTFGTTLQEGLVDTMSDLFFSVCGAAACLAWAALPRRERKPRDQAAR
jgi:hypothetical protein